MHGTRCRLSFRTLFLVCTVGMALGLIALAGAVLWLEASNRTYSARADMARQQALLVARLETEAMRAVLDFDNGGGKNRTALERAAYAYLASIDDEFRLLSDDNAELDRQTDEAMTGRRLFAVIRSGTTTEDLDRVRAMVRTVAHQENQEASLAIAAAAQAAKRTWWLICAIMAALLALPAVSAILLWRNLVMPLRGIVRATDEVANGCGPTRLKVEGLKETRKLIEHFNQMAGAVESRVAQRTALLQQANAKLSETDRRRRLFLSKVSHELRTPVTVMRGEAEVALRFAEGEQPLREALQHVLDSNLFLQRRLDDLLTLARAEDGALPLQHAACDLAGVARQAGQATAAFAAASGVRVEVDDLDAAMPVVGDGEKLCQALVALIDNGVKFSPPGGTVRLRGTHSAGGYGIAISDEGPGVHPQDLERIFDPYVQGDAGRALGGTGLGLSLARWIAQAHDGTITAANGKQGEGLCVSLILPGAMAVAA